MTQEELYEAFGGVFGNFGFGNAGFGGAGMRAGPRPGPDIQVALRLSFLEAAGGVTRKITVPYEVRKPRSNRGDNGYRRERKTKTVEVTIPAGVDAGTTLRMSGEGGEGDQGGEAGDLYIEVEVEADPYFKRDGVDVHVDVPVKMVDAVLGTSADVLTLDGIVELKVPAGTQPDTKLLMRGKGIRHLGNKTKRGDHIVHLKVEIPKNITPHQRDLLLEFEAAGQPGYNHAKYQAQHNPTSSSSSSERSKGFTGSMADAFSRLKDYFNSTAEPTPSSSSSTTGGGGSTTTSGTSGDSASSGGAAGTGTGGDKKHYSTAATDGTNSSTTSTNTTSPNGGDESNKEKKADSKKSEDDETKTKP